jgi:serine/threonine protein kinase
LLGAEKYGTEIDMWSIGCVFGELLTKEPLLQGKNEVDQVSKVCMMAFFFFLLLCDHFGLGWLMLMDTDLCPDWPSNTADMAWVPVSS